MIYVCSLFLGAAVPNGPRFVIDINPCKLEISNSSASTGPFSPLVADLPVSQIQHCSTSGHCFYAGTTMPDAHSLSLLLGLAPEGASKRGVPADSNFQHQFPGGTRVGLVFTHDAFLVPLLCCQPKSQTTILS